MSLTEEGQHLYEVLVSALGQIDDALKDVGDTQLEPTGLLRINSSRVAARMLVEPHIGEFLTRYPKTKIRTHYWMTVYLTLLRTAVMWAYVLSKDWMSI